MLAQVAIKALKPREKPYRVADGNALYLLVRSDGSMHWVHRYRVAGKEKSLSYYVTRNLRAILGELRAGLEVTDTNAVRKFSLTPAGG